MDTFGTKINVLINEVSSCREKICIYKKLGLSHVSLKRGSVIQVAMKIKIYTE